MGNKGSRSSVLSYDVAIKRLTPEELERLQNCFKQHSSPSTELMSLNAFIQEVLSDTVPRTVAENLFTSFGAQSRGLAFKDLVCSLVILTKGNLDERAKFLFNLFSDDGQFVYSHTALTLLKSLESESIEKARSEKRDVLREFHQQEKLSFNDFFKWAMIHKSELNLLEWFLESQPSLSNTASIPTFYQLLAGITHLEEREIMDLEKQYWSLCDPRYGKLTEARFCDLVSPSIPTKIISKVFAAFDDNRDDMVDFKELVCGISACCRGPKTERHKFCFKVFDPGNLGCLSRADAELMMETFLHVRQENHPLEMENDDAQSLDAMAIAGDLFESRANKQAGLLLNEFLIWSVDNYLPDDFLDLLVQMCHVVFRFRPHSKREERTVIRGWLDREHRRGLIEGQRWFIVCAEWWQKWESWTSSDCSVPSVSQSGSGASTPSVGQTTPITRRVRADSTVAWSDSNDVVITSMAPLKDDTTQLAVDFDSGSENGRCGKPSSYSVDSGVESMSRNIRNWSPCQRSEELSPTIGSTTPMLSAAPPKAIDNSPIVAKVKSSIPRLTCLTQEGGHLRTDRTLQAGRDFVLVPEVIWSALVTWYSGGSPILPRKVIRSPESKKLDIELYLVSLILLRHQSPGAAPPANPILPAVSLGGMVSGLSTFAGNAASAAMSYISQNIKRVPIQLRLVPESTRLWLIMQQGNKEEENNILLEDDRLSLQDLRITSNSQILIEVRNKDLTWPEEMNQLARNRQTHVSKRSDTEVGLTGLNNLGNTCFMNSALQCVSNTQPLTQYFQRNVHKYELNQRNVLGMKGQMASEYARLVQDLWSGTSRVIAPLKLKWLIGKYAPQFADFQQHDCQELLAFLLDGLHEDLNRVQQRPYVELKDSDGRPDRVVAAEAWDNHLRRNKSVIVDLFHGLLRSRVLCKECDNESVRFDPFTFLSLPIPCENFVVWHIVVVRLDGTTPIKYGIRLDPDETIKIVKAKVSDLTGIKADSFLLMDVLPNSLIRAFLPDHKKVKSYAGSAFYAYEVPTLESVEGATTLKVNGLVPNGANTPCHSRSASNASVASIGSTSGNALPNLLDPASGIVMTGYTLAIHRRIDHADNYLVSYRQPRPFIFGLPLVVPADRGTEVWTGLALYQCVWLQVSRLVSPLPKQLCQTNHAQDGDACLYPPYPFVLRVVSKTGRYCALCPWFRFCIGCEVNCTEEEYKLNGNLIAVDWDMTALHLRYQHALERAFDEHESIADLQRLQSQPFSLQSCLQAFTREETIEEYQCSKCKRPTTASKKLDIWKLPPVLIFHIKRFQFISERWIKSCKAVDFPFDSFDPTDFMASDDQPLMQSYHAGGDQYAALQSTQDEATTGMANGDVHMRSPRVERVRTKSEVGVDRFDHWLTTGFQRSELHYDLYAVACHSGMLGAGHYVTYAKHANRKWYLYNDSSCKEVKPSEIECNLAYMLFYERRGLDYNRYVPDVGTREATATASEPDAEFDDLQRKYCVLQ